MKKKNTKSPRARRSEQFVVVRCYGAGVHVGTLVSVDGKQVVLRDARRLWRWRGANTLHEVAMTGVSTTEYTRLSEPVPEITLLDAIEVIPATDAAKATLCVSRWLP